MIQKDAWVGTLLVLFASQEKSSPTMVRLVKMTLVHEALVQSACGGVGKPRLLIATDCIGG
jgi:hypothetical protein